VPTNLDRSVVAPAYGSLMQLARFAWLGPLALLSAAVTVNGVPVCSVTMELNCHPPIKRLAIPSLFSIRPPLPMGNSQVACPMKRCVTSNGELLRSRL